MSRPKKYPDELRERAVRLVFDSGRAIVQVVNDVGVHKEAPRLWVRPAEADAHWRGSRGCDGGPGEHPVWHPPRRT